MNIGSNKPITVSSLAGLIQDIAGARLELRYDPTGARGVSGRNADIRLAKNTIDWEPKVSLREGIEALYLWIHEMVSSDASGAHNESRGATTEEPVSLPH
jgi:nucleoside-diphosphate-sugar epimerase